MKQRSRLVALVLVLLPVLAACSFEMHYDIKDADNVTLSAKFNATKQEIEKLGGAGMPSTDMICQELQKNVNREASGNKAVTVKDLSSGDSISCEVTGKGKTTDVGKLITHDGDEFKITVNNSKDGTSMFQGIDKFTVSVTFPGKVVSATNDGKISGRTVTWDDPSKLGNGTDFEAVGKDKGGFMDGPWLWIILGVIAVAAIGAVVFVVLRSRKKSSAGGPGYGPGPGGPGASGSGYGPGPGGPGYGGPQGGPPSNYGDSQGNAPGNYGGQQHNPGAPGNYGGPQGGPPPHGGNPGSHGGQQ